MKLLLHPLPYLIFAGTLLAVPLLTSGNDLGLLVFLVLTGSAIGAGGILAIFSPRVPLATRIVYVLFALLLLLALVFFEFSFKLFAGLQ